MRKHGGTPSPRDKHVTLAAISPSGVARGRFVGGHQSGLAGCKPPPLFTGGISSCSSQGRRQGEPWGASPRPSAPTYLPTYWLVAKLPPQLWDECRSTAERKARALNYEDLSVLLLELALEKESDQHLNAYPPGGGGSESHGKGYQGPRAGQGTTPKHARIIGNVQELFWCDARDEHGHLQHTPDCEQRDCFVVQGKKQETNTGAKPKMPDHYRCTITCAFCGKRKHYEDECYDKQRLSAKLKGEDPGKGSGKSVAKATATTPARARRKVVGKDKTRTKVDEEEALIASQPRTPRTRTRMDATPTLIQGGTSSPLEGSLVLPHARRLRHSENKVPSVSMKVVMTATPRREAVS